MTATATTQRPVSISTRRVRITAVVAATLTNTVLYVSAWTLGTDFQVTDPGKTEPHQLLLPEIAVFTALFALLGWGALAVLERVTRHARAVWTALALAVLGLSFVLIGLEQATSSTKVMLCVIHIVVAAALFPLLRTARRA